MNRLFCDGGVILKNPSDIAGTWAWVQVEGEEEQSRCAGVITPSDLQTEVVTNNNTELYAMLLGINALPAGWSGTVCSDSGMAVGWVFQGYSVVNVPETLRHFMKHVLQQAQRRGVEMEYLLLAGHPTKADLAAGHRVKKAPHLPVSNWNQLCDTLCTESGRSHLLSIKAEEPPPPPPEPTQATEQKPGLIQRCYADIEAQLLPGFLPEAEAVALPGGSDTRNPARTFLFAWDGAKKLAESNPKWGSTEEGKELGQTMKAIAMWWEARKAQEGQESNGSE